MILDTTIKGHRAEQILGRAQQQLLNERVRQINFTIEALTDKLKHLNQKLKTALPDTFMEEVLNFIKKAQLSQHKKVKERQSRKFQNLQSKAYNTSRSRIVSQHEDITHTHTKENWVKNLSDRELTQTEKDVLAKGLNFAISPKALPVVDLITATESAIRSNRLAQPDADQLRLKVTAALSSAKLPPSNCSHQERIALTTLSKDDNITILPADKGRCTVVLNTTEYHTKIMSLLRDNNTYESLKRDPTANYKKKVIDCLQTLEREGAIDRKLYYKLYPGEDTPCIYGLPKIHKEGVPLRPIVSSINSVTYNIAKHLATILAPLVGSTPHHIHNSSDFVNKIKNLKMSVDETMVSFDVTSLFTCIPTAEAVESVMERLQQDTSLSNRTGLNPKQIGTLLNLCLTTTYFKFRNDFFRQKHGCAMGSPVSPIVANLYMEKMELKALASYKGTTPSHWFRYVDDTWVKIKTHEVIPFTDHINSVDNNIKFTREDTKENRLPFLDCAVKVEQDGSLNIEVYRKPTHTDQYLMFDSHHPLEHKLGVIRTLKHRADRVATKTEGKLKEHSHIKEALKTCGFPNWAFTRVARRKEATPSGEQEERRNGIVIPYVAGVSEKFRRIFSKHNIPVHFKPKNTVRQKLVHPKDKTPRQKLSNVVYAVQCSEECNDLYIGETKQPLHRRMAQHRRASSSGQDSAVHLHLKETGHTFEDHNVHILDREDRWFERGVKEAIFVKQETPSLNRGGGLRFQLSSTYNAVLKSLPTRLHKHLDTA